MSVIGPRPGLWNQDFLTAERDKYGANDIKPGLTGWAQINGRDGIEILVKAKLDGEYKVYHYLAVSYEIRKFKDKRRTEIYSKVKLTKEQMDQIDQLYVNYYGKKIPYTWHKHFTAFAGNFDPKFIPEHIYIPEFEKYMNQWGFYADVLQDKNFLTLLANSMDVKMPKLLVYCSRGVFHVQYSLQIITIIVNTAACIFLIRLGASIQVVKFTTSVIFLCRPLVMEWITFFMLLR